MIYASTLNTEGSEVEPVGINGCAMPPQTLQFCGLHKVVSHKYFCGWHAMMPYCTPINLGLSKRRLVLTGTKECQGRARKGTELYSVSPACTSVTRALEIEYSVGEERGVT